MFRIYGYRFGASGFEVALHKNTRELLNTRSCSGVMQVLQIRAKRVQGLA